MKQFTGYLRNIPLMRKSVPAHWSSISCISQNILQVMCNLLLSCIHPICWFLSKISTKCKKQRNSSSLLILLKQPLLELLRGPPLWAQLLVIKLGLKKKKHRERKIMKCGGGTGGGERWDCYDSCFRCKHIVQFVNSSNCSALVSARVRASGLQPRSDTCRLRREVLKKNKKSNGVNKKHQPWQFSAFSVIHFTFVNRKRNSSHM